MKRLLATTVLALTVVLNVGSAYASCTINQVRLPDGKTMLCRTCCNEVGCRTECR